MSRIDAVGQQLNRAVDLQMSKHPEEAFVEYLNCVNRISDILRPLMYQLSSPQGFYQQQEEQLQRLFHFGRECFFQCETMYTEKLQQMVSQQQQMKNSPQPSAPPILTISQPNYQPNNRPLSASFSSFSSNVLLPPPPSPSYRSSPTPVSPSPYFYPIASEGSTPRSNTPSISSSTSNSTLASGGWTVVNVKPRFKDREIEQLQKQFEAIDSKSRDGRLDIAEFSQSFGCIPMGMDKRKGSVLSDFIWRPKCKVGSFGFNSSLFALFDQNKSTFIELDDYKNTLGILLFGSKEEQLQLAFGMFDRDHRGYISREDYLYIMNLIADNLEHMGFTLYSDRQQCTTQFLAIFNAMSSNGKFVTKSEFITCNTQRPHLLGSLGLISSNQPFFARTLPKSGFAVAPGHSSWNKMLNMMLGIRSSQEQANWLFNKGYIGSKQQQTFEEYLVREQDFSLCISITLPPLIDTYSVYRDAYNTYMFTDFAPVIFKKIRSLFGITEEEYFMSLSPEQFFGHLLQGKLTSLSEKLTEGKSGNFFFYSHNGLFLCKTISTGELNTFRRILPYYYQHICENPDTLLCRFYGLHQLNNVAFVVMGNVFETDYKMKEIFDLKGSTYKRTNPDIKGVRKDLDFIELGRKLRISEPRRSKLLNQLSQDTKLLEAMQIIDYSLLVGIADNPNADLIPRNQSGSIVRISPNVSNRKRPPFYQTFDGGLLSDDGKEIYYLGIIDTLIEYGMLKFAEHQIKSLIQGNDISVIEPKDYSARFIRFMLQSIE